MSDYTNFIKKVMSDGDAKNIKEAAALWNKSKKDKKGKKGKKGKKK